MCFLYFSGKPSTNQPTSSCLSYFQATETFQSEILEKNGEKIFSGFRRILADQFLSEK